MIEKIKEISELFKNVMIPEGIKKDMHMWREGFDSFPESYIEFHLGLANRALDEIKKLPIIIHKTWIGSDGWMDGMRILYVIAEYRNRLFKLHWHDGNKEFFFKHISGGSSPLSLSFDKIEEGW